ncbi:cytidylate kinase [Alkalibaculum bacchi]|uniref:Cytidylate kinase n=1 Tax=Alkalibaculum bacchi TaxID=645887 RepID=A0A366I3W4_9FIRM|nr:(d)CMP kinase [Alkalibaculum bacchi]RBP61837.1 cytidylate kinase [Alkalibaculum bacchi]
MKNIHIAIDGPAGAGKSTIAKRLAQEIHIDYLDTGAMYRALTYHILQLNVDVEDEETIIKEAEKIDIDFNNNCIYLNGINVDIDIRTQKVSNNVSAVSKFARVRELMVDKQREIANGKSVIMDGRDIGTVVLPKAEYKFYLDASIDIRAQRRYEQLDQNMDIEELKRDIANRDKMDQTREVSPLKKADDAIVIDTSNMTIDEVLQTMKSIINEEEGE